MRVIYHRSACQQVTENTGGMAVVVGPREAAEKLVARTPDLTVAAHNSHRCIAIAGPFASLAEIAKLAPAHKLRVRKLDVEYPFHTQMMDVVKKPLLASLTDLAPVAGSVLFMSTVVGAVVDGRELSGPYWWRNVREPVLFQEGVEQALHAGKRLFLEIGPRPTLFGHIRDAAEHLAQPAAVDSVLDEKQNVNGPDPFEEAAKRLIAAGAEADLGWAFGPDPGAGIELPAYPWRRSVYRYGETSEATGQLRVAQRHPLIGAREDPSALEWRAIVDTEIEPALAGHKVRGQVMLPGAAFLEMGLAVARDWAGEEAALAGFEILQPMTFGGTREIRCRVSAATGTVEIMSRPRFSTNAYATHARGKIFRSAGPAPEATAPPPLSKPVEAEEVYRRAVLSSLEYGPSFRQLARAEVATNGTVEVELIPMAGDRRYGLDPARLDSCFHGLILLFAERSPDGGAYLPVRFEETRLLRPAADLSRASILIRRFDDRAIVADFELFDSEGRLVATLRGARYQATRLRAEKGLGSLGLTRRWVAATRDLAPQAARPGLRKSIADAPADTAEPSGSAMLMEGWAMAAAYQLARRLGAGGLLDPEALVADGRLPAGHRRWAETVFAALEQSGLLKREGAKFSVVDEDVPAPEAILSALAAQHPERAPELLLAAGVGAILTRFAEGAEALAAPSEAAVDGYERRSISTRAARSTLSARLETMSRATRSDPALRILQVGAGPEIQEMIGFAIRRGARLTVFEPDARRLERARFHQTAAAEVAFCGEVDALADETFDLVVSVGGFSRLINTSIAFSSLAAKCAPEGLLMGFEPPPTLFRDLTLGLAEIRGGGDAARRLGPKAWKTECARSGLLQAVARRVDFGWEQIIEVVAEAPARAPIAVSATSVVVLNRGEETFVRALDESFAARGVDCKVSSKLSPFEAKRVQTLIWIAGQDEQDAPTRVAAACLALRDLALAVGPARVRALCHRGGDGSRDRRSDLSLCADVDERVPQPRRSSRRDRAPQRRFGPAAGGRRHREVGRDGYRDRRRRGQSSALHTAAGERNLPRGARRRSQAQAGKEFGGRAGPAAMVLDAAQSAR